jgi:hypothetical protein
MLYPKGSKQPKQVWASVMNVPQASSGPVVSPSSTPQVTSTPTLTPTPTASLGQTPTPTPNVTSTPTNTQTGTPVVTSSPTNTPTQTQSGTPQITSSPTNTPTNTQTKTPQVTTTPTSTPTQTQTGTPNVTSSPTNTPTQTQSGTPAVTSSPTQTITPTNTLTQTPTNTTTPTNTLTPTPSTTPPPKLLDSYPNAYIAVSTRKLRSAYAGSALRIRRDSDTTQTDVGFDDNGDINVSTINTFCSGTGCAVVTWYDQSGNARNLLADPSSAPKIYLSGSATTINNKVSPYFNGGNFIGVGGLSPGSVSLASWFNLGYRTGGSNPAYIIGMDPGNKIELANTLGIVDAGATVGSFGTAFSTGLTQSSVLRESGNSKAYINGTQSSTTNTTGLSNLTGSWGLTLGVNSGTGGEYWVGYLPEWVLYVGRKQSSNRAGIDANQKSYWGTP